MNMVCRVPGLLPCQSRIAQSSNTPPSTPGTVQGPTQGNADQQLSFSTSATDPNGDRVRIVMDWGDGTQNQSDLVASGTTVSLSHTWSQAGTYQVRAQALDENGSFFEPGLRTSKFRSSRPRRRS